MAENGAPPQRRLNRFAFPSETDVRFTLFIVAILALALSAGELTRYILNPDQPAPFSDNSAPNAVPGQSDFFEQYLAYDQRLFGEALSALAFPVGLTIVIFMLTIVLYRLHPTRLRRQKHLEPLLEEKDPYFYREIQSLARSVGVSPPPTVMLGKGLRSQSSQAFGLPQRYVLRLEGGLRLLFRKAPSAFRAIVLHELAHIANRDVGRTYFAQALWNAAILLVILPLSLSTGVVFISSTAWKAFTHAIDLNRLVTIVLPTVLFIYFQLCAIVALIAVIRASLLRARELYADGRAALWGAEASLSALLKRGSVQDKAARGVRWWRLHPTADERLAALHNPASLFRIPPDLPFTVGLLIAVVAGELFWESIVVIPGINAAGGYLSTLFAIAATTNQHFPLLFWTLISLSQFVLLGSTLLVVVLVVLVIFSLVYVVSSTIGLEAQREAVAELIVSRPGYAGYLRMGWTAALIALGLETAFLITPDSGLGSFFAIDPASFFATRGLVLVLLTIAEFIFATGVAWLWLVYARFFGQSVFGSHTGPHPPKWKRRFLTLAVSGVLFILFLPIALAHGVIVSVGLNKLILDVGLILRVLGALVGALFLYTLMFGMSWVCFQIGRRIWPPRCPTCGRATLQKNVLGQMCEHCGKDLAPWLFATSFQDNLTSL